MPPPVITITQGLSVTVGVPNLDVVTGTPVTFSLGASYGAYEWQLISRPVNHSLVESGDALVPPLTLATVTVTPTFKGTYKVRFIADLGVGLDKIAELWFYARNPGDLLIASTATLPRRHPAYTEGAETGGRGATTELDAWLFVVEDLWDVVLNPLVGAGGDLSGPVSNATVIKIQNQALSGAAPAPGNVLQWNGAAWAPATVSGAMSPVTFVFGGVSGSQENAGTGSNTYKGIGSIVLDPSALSSGGPLTRTIKFRAVLEGVSGVTAQVKLFNVDDGEDVTGTTLSVASTTPARLISGTLTVGAGVGDVKNALRTYEVQLQVLTPSPAGAGDGCTCKLAQLEVTYT